MYCSADSMNYHLSPEKRDGLSGLLSWCISVAYGGWIVGGQSDLGWRRVVRRWGQYLSGIRVQAGVVNYVRDKIKT